MNRYHSKLVLILLFIVGFFLCKLHGYNHSETVHHNYDEGQSDRVTFADLTDSINLPHRAKRALHDPTMITDVYTSYVPLMHARISNTTNLSGIYIISSFISSVATSVATVQTTEEPTTVSATTATTTNGTYIITNFILTTYTSQSITFLTNATMPTTVSPTARFCVNGTHILLSNGTCVSRNDAQIEAIGIMYSNSSNDTNRANSLTTYISSITNSSTPSNSNNTLTINQINNVVASFNTSNYTVNTNDTMLLITKPNRNATVTIIGASFRETIGGTIVNMINRNNVTNSNISVAGIVTLDSLTNATSFNMLIVNDPTAFNNADKSSNKTISSSVIMATIDRPSSNNSNTTIDLYFQIVKQPNVADVTYLCSYFNSSTLQWSEQGCTAPVFNAMFSRYECTCNHLTSFALVWLPKTQSSSNSSMAAKFEAQDIVSILFQIVSVCCFIGVIIYDVVILIYKPQQFVKPLRLLPLAACAITMVLFVFYIALGLTVYSRFSQSNGATNNSSPMKIPPRLGDGYQLEGRQQKKIDVTNNSSSSNGIPCLSNEHALMFIVFFLIIFMFCVKTSIGFYNYRRYVQLHPPPSLRNLCITIVISFFVAIIYMIIAAGLNSNPSNQISEVQQGKICWFTVRVIHYFITIPICLFLASSVILIALVARSLLLDFHDAETDALKRKRRKHLIIVVLTSSVTQGLGWLFGPLIMFIADSTTGSAFGWLFVICNGLEGLWSLLLYYFARKEHLDENKRSRDYNAFQFQNLDPNADVPEAEPDPQIRSGIPERRRHMRSASPRNFFMDIFPLNKSLRTNPNDVNN